MWYIVSLFFFCCFMVFLQKLLTLHAYLFAGACVHTIKNHATMTSSCTQLLSLIKCRQPNRLWKVPWNPDMQRYYVFLVGECEFITKGINSICNREWNWKELVAWLIVRKPILSSSNGGLFQCKCYRYTNFRYIETPCNFANNSKFLN